MVLRTKILTKQIYKELLSKSAGLTKQGVQPKLAVIQVGSDPASSLYVRLKQKAAQNLGIIFESVKFGPLVSARQVVKKITALNNDPLVHGIIVQLPVPKFSKRARAEVVNSISLLKDIDGLTDQNRLAFMQDKFYFLPAAVKAVLFVLRFCAQPQQSQPADVEAWQNFLQNHSFLVIGAKGFVGSWIRSALAKELGREFTLAQNTASLPKTLKKGRVYGIDRRTPIGQYSRQADCIISAVGRPGLITGRMVKTNSILLDVGTAAIRESKQSLKGDFDFPSCKDKALVITPVPGGIGPLTVAFLFDNLLTAVERRFTGRI